MPRHMSSMRWAAALRVVPCWRRSPRTFPAGEPLAAVFDAFPGVTERLYGLVARNRGLISRMTRL